MTRHRHCCTPSGAPSIGAFAVASHAAVRQYSHLNSTFWAALLPFLFRRAAVTLLRALRSSDWSNNLRTGRATGRENLAGKERETIMKLLHTGVALALLAGPAIAADSDSLKVPPGFHATIVADGLGPMRHLAIRDNGDIYLSSGRGIAIEGGAGIVAVRLGADHKATQIEHFGVVDGGTGIRIWHNALYAASPSRVYRFSFHGKDLLPNSEPTVIVDHIPKSKQSNHAIVIDQKGNLYVSVDGTDNICAAPAPSGAAPVGLKPCPDLGVRSGIWKFSATKTGQSFERGEQIATGIRDLNAMDAATDGRLYGIMHGRDTTARQFPAVASQADDDHIADEMAVVDKGADFGWPYSYYDGERKLQLVAPEYGGDGKTVATGNYVKPVLTFQSKRAAPLDLVFYNGKMFPAQYRGGAFIALHGTGGQKIEGGQTGHDIVFVPRGPDGKIGAPVVFAEGFFETAQRGAPPPANNYRPSGVAVGPDGALYVVDSVKGRL